MSKNFFVALVIIFLTTLLAFIIHSISSSEDFFANNKAEEKKEDFVEVNSPGEQEDKGVNVKKIHKLVDGADGPVKGAVLNSTTSQVLYYQNRNFLLVDFKGQAKNSIGGYPFIGIKEVTWNSNKDKALIKDQGEYLIYDLNKNINTTTKLSSDMEYAVWYKNQIKGKEDRIVYKSFDSEKNERKMMIADYDGENKQVIVDNLQYKKVSFKISKNGNKICFFRYPDANFETSFDCVNLKDGQIETLHKGIFAADYLWADNGNRTLASYVNKQLGNKMILGEMNAKGGEFKNLNFPTTVEKCVWAKDNRKVYCAMMVFAEEDIVLPNDWNSGKYNSRDTFWEIDVESGKKRRLVESDEMIAVDAEGLFLDENEKYLFFTDKETKSVYSISLK